MTFSVLDFGLVDSCDPTLGLGYFGRPRALK